VPGRGFQIELDAECLTVTLVLTDERPAEEITRGQVLRALAQRRVRVEPPDEDRIARLMNWLRAGIAPETRLVLVRGTPPVHGRDGQAVEIFQEPPVAAGPPGHWSEAQEVFHLVEAGDPVLKLRPPTSGRAGVDVFGRPVSPRPGRPAPVCLGPNVRLSDDETRVLATASGRFTFSDGTATVQPELTIDQATTLPAAPIEFGGDVYVQRDLEERVEIRGGHNVLVTGTVEGATIEADRSVVVSGGILGRELGRITAGRHISCQFANGARLRAGRDIAIAKYCYDSQIRCDGTLHMEQAVLSGGRACAARGAIIGTVGTPQHRQTVLTVGFDPDRHDQRIELEQSIRHCRLRIEELQRQYEPYRSCFDMLRGVERATAEEILREITSLESGIARAKARIDELQRPRPSGVTAPLVVRERLAAGVELQLAVAIVVVPADLEGPLRIELHHGHDGARVIAVNEATGDWRPLLDSTRGAA
jgi:uncharacterized protein (DUF342 family)